MCHYGISTVLLFNPKNLAGYPSRLFSFVPEPVTGTVLLNKETRSFWSIYNQSRNDTKYKIKKREPKWQSWTTVNIFSRKRQCTIVNPLEPKRP